LILFVQFQTQSIAFVLWKNFILKMKKKLLTFRSTPNVAANSRFIWFVRRSDYHTVFNLVAIDLKKRLIFSIFLREIWSCFNFSCPWIFLLLLPIDVSNNERFDV